MDIVCYTKSQELQMIPYVAYVTYEVKFRSVETLAPGLMWCYVVKKMTTAIILSGKM